MSFKAEENALGSKNQSIGRRGLNTALSGPISPGGLQVQAKRKPRTSFLSETSIPSGSGSAITANVPSLATCVANGHQSTIVAAAPPVRSALDKVNADIETCKEMIVEVVLPSSPSAELEAPSAVRPILQAPVDPSDDGMGNLLPNRPSTPHMVKSKTKFKSPSNLFDDVEVDDLDYLEENNSGLLISPDPSHVWLTMPQGSPITSETAIELKTLVLGSYRKSFPDEWKFQDFSLNKSPVLKYGIVQKKGGPCGVIACVGAHLIKEVFFNRSWRNFPKSEIPEEEAKKCLALALANILWRCGGNKAAVIALPSNRQVFDDVRPGLCDGLIEKITLMHFNDLAALQSFLNRHIGWYTDNDKFSCIAFLYSAILSRGIENVKHDMDDPKTCFVGAHDYCSQEVVNLLLTGCASSNVFDNVITLDDGNESRSVFKGITKGSDIGYLALYEHYNSCQVGSYFKYPRYPIWVVCSESHFSILFGKDTYTCEKNANKPNDTNAFDLYYYDGLLNQESEIKLSIDWSKKFNDENVNKHQTPPLEHCIRTKWKGAMINWNGTEPLL